MIRFLLASVAAWGTFLGWTALAHGWTGFGLGPRTDVVSKRLGAIGAWMAATGAPPLVLVSSTIATGSVGMAAGWLAFAAPVPALIGAACTAWVPIGALRRRDGLRAARTREGWPRVIDEIRVLTGSAGRSIPVALFEAASRGPEDLARVVAPAHRRWLMTADFSRTVTDLKAAFGDHTADVTLETLLIAHEVGGTDLDLRLFALASDRRRDVAARRTAAAEQAGVRFARRFVLLVPFGMAIAGSSIGPGRAAFRDPEAQIATAIAIAIVAVCWVWSGRIMELPAPKRVLAR